MKNTNLKDTRCYKLFVYGTLQDGQSRNIILKGLRYEKATLFNYKKVISSSLGFPFIVRDDSSNVKGEVYYDIDESIISEIDRIEGEGELYHRIVVKVTLLNGKELEAYTYYPSEILVKNYL
jgi:gamma-glutamylcyclotransferase (GGCT)/AIG2-like uncharacterized protein YtfP